MNHIGTLGENKCKRASPRPSRYSAIIHWPSDYRDDRFGITHRLRPDSTMNKGRILRWWQRQSSNSSLGDRITSSLVSPCATQFLFVESYNQKASIKRTQDSSPTQAIRASLPETTITHSFVTTKNSFGKACELTFFSRQVV